MTFCASSHKAHLLCMKLSQVTQYYSKGLCVILLHAHIHGLQAVHAQQCLGLLERHGAWARETSFSFHATNTVFQSSCYDCGLQKSFLWGFGGEWEPLKQLLPGNSGLCKHIKYCILKAALGQSTVMLKTGTQEWLRHYLPPLNGDSISSPEWLLSEQENGSNCIQPVPNHSLIALF